MVASSSHSPPNSFDAAANTIAGIIDTQVTLAFPALTTRLTRPISPSRRVR